MEQTEEIIGIKIYNAEPSQEDEPIPYPSTTQCAPGGCRKRRAVANGVQKTLSKTSMLANFLPTGTLLTFEMVIPSIYHNGECTPVSTLMIHVLLGLCALSCFFFHFTDSFRGPDGKVYYGFVTHKGLAVFKPGLNVDVPKEERYKLGFTDFVHAIMSVMVFMAIALSDHRVTNCLFPGHEKDMDESIHGMVRLRFLTTKQIYPPKTYNCNWNVDSDSIKQQCLFLLKSCSFLDQLFQIHAQILIVGLQKDEQIVDKIIQFCALHPSGSLNHARRAIIQSENQITSSWNNLIRGYATKGDSPREAVWVFLAMRRSRTRPNELTYPFLFKASVTFSGLKEGRQIHADVLKHRVDDDVYVQNTVIHFYGSCKKIVHACRMFDEMLFRTLVSWNSIISSCVDNLWFYESIKYFVRMKNCGLKPDETTMVILLSACAEHGNLNLGKWVHAKLLRKGWL
ncbi:unnamed protein product [Ilex paraguariensis]|uniref:Pentatricopeptide repeat-containing protein n=1 Tax=Ilex paraguariensis TaxID=185542 RepID=A0ABC8T776_9AQUA